MNELVAGNVAGASQSNQQALDLVQLHGVAG
jgi:hypothetical protein